MPMKLTTLRYLVAFADEGTLSRAAERCGVSQPTLSVALQNLEADLEAALIERSQGHAALTDLGRKVVEQARRTLDEADRVAVVARSGSDPLKGEFRLGVIHTIGPYLLPRLVGALKVRAPAMSLYIEESMTALLADYLKYGTVEAAIIALPFDVPGIETRALYDEPFRVIVPRRHRWAKRKSLSAAEVHQEKVLVLKAGNCFREQVLDACPDISHAEGALLEGHSIETVRCMVASGHGISVLPASALGGPYTSDLVTAIPFTAPAPTRRVAIAWRKGSARAESIAALADAAAAVVEETGGWREP